MELKHEKHNARDKGRESHKPFFGNARKDFDNIFSSEKQREYAKEMVATCERCGIDLSFARPRFGTAKDCTRVINLSYTMLKKNGYDGYGNKLEGEKV